ncbi:MAG: hypothetical protein D6E12_03145 [Desulfovibrio sp.]|nr:MAG: hypothetical protein D6E12_03145 [Desulfovibrio sp.]
MAEFVNDDKALLERVEKSLESRQAAELEGSVGGLQAVIVNVEPGGQREAVNEFLRFTGYDFAGAFEDEEALTYVLKLEGSADFLFRSRKVANPFLSYNKGPKSNHQPNARLETFVYTVDDLNRFIAIQKQRGISFVTPLAIDRGNYLFIQTVPSRFTGNSTGFIQWKERQGDYAGVFAKPLDMVLPKPKLKHLAFIGRLDHSATRVHAEHRDDAIIEFMDQTCYTFAFAVYVESLNSITNVARLAEGEYAQVFTSGIKPFTTLDESGPTERFIHNYGLRVHHLAFETQDIENTFSALKADGLGFLVDLVGGPDEGLHQTFSNMSGHTFLVNEYILRYGGFDGFFTKSNVTELTLATDKQ